MPVTQSEWHSISESNFFKHIFLFLSLYRQRRTPLIYVSSPNSFSQSRAFRQKPPGLEDSSCLLTGVTLPTAGKRDTWLFINICLWCVSMSRAPQSLLTGPRSGSKAAFLPSTHSRIIQEIFLSCFSLIALAVWKLSPFHPRDGYFGFFTAPVFHSI